jgi:hypothetical protein
VTYLVARPQLIASAAADIAEINSAIDAAKFAAAGPTTGVMAAAADEVSAAAAALFGGYGQQYQALLKQAAVFPEEFVQALAGAGRAYAAADAANAAAISGALGQLTSPIRSLLGGSGVASPAITPMAPAPPFSPGLQGTIFGLFIGPSSVPVPPPSYVTATLPYVHQGFPGLTTGNSQPLFTPEGLYPLTGVKTLPLNTSVAEGVQILDSAIKNTLADNAGDSVAVLGYSQSAIISSIEMENLANHAMNPMPPGATQLGFTLLGDPMNPNGGLLSRFAGLTLPSLGVDFYGATPQNTPYPTNIYTLQYDGFADFPRYPINLLADLNAFAGTYSVHGAYPDLNPSNLPAGDQLILLPGSTANPAPGGVAATSTNYYLITEPNLPLLNVLRAIPIVGNPLADLVQPDLTTIVNLGYGDPSVGYSTSPANLPTPFGLFPHVSQQLIASDLAAGAQQGAHAFVSDISSEAAAGVSLPTLSHSLASITGSGASLPALTSTLASLAPDGIIQSIQALNTKISTAIATAASDGYSVLLPTADFLNAAVISIPSYDINLVLNGILQAVSGDPLGGLSYALIAPFAADTALYTVVFGFEAQVLLSGITGAIGALTSI